MPNPSDRLGVTGKPPVAGPGALQYILYTLILHYFVLLQNNTNNTNKYCRLHYIINKQSLLEGGNTRERTALHHKTENNRLVVVAFSL